MQCKKSRFSGKFSLERTSDGAGASKRSTEAAIAIRPAARTAGAMRQRREVKNCQGNMDSPSVITKAHCTFNFLHAYRRATVATNALEFYYSIVLCLRRVAKTCPGATL